ncbi:MAG: phosphoethanolamine transferase domain-containing protein, partial [Rubrivivax sp.]
MLHSNGAPAAARYTFDITLEPLLALASLFWAFSANKLFLQGALQGRNFADWQTWGFALALLVMLTALHYLLLALLTLLMPRPLLRPLLALLIVATAAAAYFMQTFGVYLDPTMLRNALQTDVVEARELLSWSLLAHMLVYAALPLVLLWRVRVRRHARLPALGLRLFGVALALALLLGTLVLVFQPFASLMRNHRELRYQATPANYVWSLGAVAAAQARGAARPRQPIGLDALPGPRTAALGRGQRPLVVVLVVGETARAANWGLNGYARQTTPELARVPGLISFAQVDSCGTNTEVSLPCMFAPV